LRESDPSLDLSVHFLSYSLCSPSGLVKIDARRSRNMKPCSIYHLFLLVSYVASSLCRKLAPAPGPNPSPTFILPKSLHSSRWSECWLASCGFTAICHSPQKPQGLRHDTSPLPGGASSVISSLSLWLSPSFFKI
jgi:hypothetical protein